LQLDTEDRSTNRQQHLAAMAGDEQVERFLLSIIIVAGDSFVALNPPLRASCEPLALMAGMTLLL